MRPLRKKMVGKGCIYHICNRHSGGKDELLFTDVDKEFGIKLLKRLCDFYLLEVISYCFMGNHVHFILYAPAEPPSLQDAARRHNAFHGKTTLELSPELHPGRCEAVARQIIDISQFMAVFQQRFSCYFNRTHSRRGRLWADRFKSTILEGGSALWNCAKYVELNPVRAGIVDDPADYRFSSWGRYCGSGKHLFAKNFHKHMKTGTPTCEMHHFSFDEVCTLFRTELARTIASEKAEATDADIKDAMDKAKRGDSMPVKFLRRTRHWVDGTIIGSKAFVQEVACQFEDQKKVLKKQLSCGKTPAGETLHCFRRLRL